MTFWTFEFKIGWGWVLVAVAVWGAVRYLG
jgi:hypothetical protein